MFIMTSLDQKQLSFHRSICKLYVNYQQQIMLEEVAQFVLMFSCKIKLFVFFIKPYSPTFRFDFKTFRTATRIGLVATLLVP